MSIYILDDNDEFIISLKKYLKENPINLEEYRTDEWVYIPPWNKGISPSEETRALLSKIGKGKKRSAESRERYRLSKLGSKNPNFGKPALKSPEISRKISEGQKNNPNHHAFKKLVCPHCQKEGAYVAMKRWHFDRCRKINQ
jgi:hypothetical protein